MPNWVSIVVNFEGEQKDIDNIFNLIKSVDEDGEDSEFDFNRLIPMPDYIYQGNLGMAEREQYGKNNWYDWSIENWGTKWNACNVSVGKSSIYLDTAWSFPAPIFEKLSEICHKNNVVMSGYFCDEDYMSGNKGYFHSGDDHNTEGIEYLDCTDLEDEDFKEIFINCLGEDWYEEALEYQREEENENDE